MKAPAFWATRNVISTLLLPASFLYRGIARIRTCITTPTRVSVPVICVGNVTTGGAGKTPVCLSLGQWCKQENINAFFVSRGYGGDAKGPVRVDINHHTACQVGDEPLLLARVLPTIVAKDRVGGAKAAIAEGAELIILDDGYQNPHLYKNISLLVVDGVTRFANERVLPAGPLRETVKEGLARASAVIIINGVASMVADASAPVFTAILTPQSNFQNQRVLAFAGIAQPAKFRRSLEQSGANIIDLLSFADHHFYNEDELTHLHTRAEKENALLVTTEKDAVRLPAAFREIVSILPVTLSFETEAFWDWLRNTIKVSP